MNQPRQSLELVDVVKDFNGIRADDGASFQVSLETVTGLIGPNGAGRTTLGRWTRVEAYPEHGGPMVLIAARGAEPRSCVEKPGPRSRARPTSQIGGAAAAS